MSTHEDDPQAVAESIRRIREHEAEMAFIEPIEALARAAILAAKALRRLVAPEDGAR